VLSGWGNRCPRSWILTVWASWATRVDSNWCMAYFLVDGFVLAVFWSFGLFCLVWGISSHCCGDVAFADFFSNFPQVRFSCSPIVLALVPLVIVPHYQEGWSVVVVDIYKERVAKLVSLVVFAN
jgi:hypothetical protein